MKTFTCQMCGKEFESTANRAIYCPDCRVERQKMRSRAYTEKLHGFGERRIIGSTDICPMCKKPYIVKSGSQKVCENCRKKYRNKQKQKPNNDYTSRAYDMFSVFVKKGEKESIKEFAKAHGMSANELFNLGLSLAVEKLSVLAPCKEAESDGTNVKIYDDTDDALLKFAVIIARSGGKWVFCKHRERETLELPGGHREPDEAIDFTARRELYEETGAIDCKIMPLFVYSVTAPNSFDGEESFGKVYFANIKALEPELHSEIERVILLDALPESPEAWTYPQIQPLLVNEYIRRQGRFSIELHAALQK